MAVKLSPEQFANADAIAENAWFEELRHTLSAHHTRLDGAMAARLFAACRAETVRLGIQSEAALHAFFDMSFALGDLVSALPEYQQMHPVFLREHGTPDRLPIYLYETCDA